MAFPADPLGIKGEMLINGAWTDVTTRLRENADVQISGGRSSEQGKITPSSCRFTLNNRDGLYSNDNPLSVYYQLLPNNTQFRVSVTESGTFAYQPNYFNTYDAANNGWSAGYLSTLDKAVLDVVGDIDLRIEIEPEHWQLGDVGMHLAGKYQEPGNQRSWAWVILPTGRMRLYWSTDGTEQISAGNYADSTVAIPGTGRIALRVTLDVNNGAAGRTIIFYTASSILGSWTQLGATVIQPTVTSIFSSSASLNAGGIRGNNGTFPFYKNSLTPSSIPMIGRLYRFQMYSGIAGTLVADANPSAQAAGTTSWSDGLGTPNTWSPQLAASITASNYRAFGEISEMPQRWDSTGRDVYVPTQADGILRRLTQGASPLRSPIYRNLSQLIGAGLLGYWPMEDGSRATTAANAVPGQPAAFIRSLSLGEDDLFPASGGVAEMTDDNGLIRGSVTNTVNANQAFGIFYHKYPVTPLADIEVFHLYTTGTIARTTFTVGAASYRISCYGRDGALLGTNLASFGSGAAPGQWLATQIRLTVNGTGIDVDLGWYTISNSAFYGLTTLNIATATLGRPSGFATAAGAALGRVSFSQIGIGNSVFDFANADFSQSSTGFNGETALERFLRITAEEGLRGLAIGWPPDSELMGPQPIDTLPNILEECVELDGGFLYEARDQAALVMRTRRSLYAQEATSLSYTSKHLSGEFFPTNDDRYTRNEVTAQRPSGSSAIATKETGTKSILAPPNGVGKYDSQIDTNSSSDARLPYLAQQAVYLGTWPDQRVPSIQVQLQRSVFVADPTLSGSIKSLNPGDRLSVTSTPAWVGGGTVDTMIQGYEETLMNRGWEFSFTTSPYGAWLAYNDLTLSSQTRTRLAATTSTLNASITSGALSIAVATPSTTAPWGSTASKPGNFPIDIMIGGERMTVSAISAWAAGVQTFTISARAVNGITKAHSAGAVVQVFDIFYAAL
jgi:hypothetical protein